MSIKKLYPITQGKNVILSGNKNLQEALGSANGIATLDSKGKIPAAQLPSVAGTNEYDNTLSGLVATNVQDAIDELATKSGFNIEIVDELPEVGDTSTIYFKVNTDILTCPSYYWDGDSVDSYACLVQFRADELPDAYNAYFTFKYNKNTNMWELYDYDQENQEWFLCDSHTSLYDTFLTSYVEDEEHYTISLVKETPSELQETEEVYVLDPSNIFSSYVYIADAWVSLQGKKLDKAVQIVEDFPSIPEEGTIYCIPKDLSESVFLGGQLTDYTVYFRVNSYNGISDPSKSIVFMWDPTRNDWLPQMYINNEWVIGSGDHRDYWIDNTHIEIVSALSDSTPSNVYYVVLSESNLFNKYLYVGGIYEQLGSEQNSSQINTDQFKVEIVQSLPYRTDAKETTMYWIPKVVAADLYYDYPGQFDEDSIVGTINLIFVLSESNLPTTDTSHMLPSLYYIVLDGTIIKSYQYSNGEWVQTSLPKTNSIYNFLLARDTSSVGTGGDSMLYQEVYTYRLRSTTLFDSYIYKNGAYIQQNANYEDYVRTSQLLLQQQVNNQISELTSDLRAIEYTYPPQFYPVLKSQQSIMTSANEENFIYWDTNYGEISDFEQSVKFSATKHLYIGTYLYTGDNQDYVQGEFFIISAGTSDSDLNKGFYLYDRRTLSYIASDNNADRLIYYPIGKRTGAYGQDTAEVYDFEHKVTKYLAYSNITWSERQIPLRKVTTDDSLNKRITELENTSGTIKYKKVSQLPTEDIQEIAQVVFSEQDLNNIKQNIVKSLEEINYTDLIEISLQEFITTMQGLSQENVSTNDLQLYVLVENGTVSKLYIQYLNTLYQITDSFNCYTNESDAMSEYFSGNFNIIAIYQAPIYLRDGLLYATPNYVTVPVTLYYKQHEYIEASINICKVNYNEISKLTYQEYANMWQMTYQGNDVFDMLWNGAQHEDLGWRTLVSTCEAILTEAKFCFCKNEHNEPCLYCLNAQAPYLLGYEMPFSINTYNLSATGFTIVVDEDILNAIQDTEIHYVRHNSSWEKLGELQNVQTIQDAVGLHSSQINQLQQNYYRKLPSSINQGTYYFQNTNYEHYGDFNVNFTVTRETMYEKTSESRGIDKLTMRVRALEILQKERELTQEESEQLTQFLYSMSTLKQVIGISYPPQPKLTYLEFTYNLDSTPKEYLCTGMIIRSNSYIYRYTNSESWSNTWDSSNYTRYWPVVTTTYKGHIANSGDVAHISDTDGFSVGNQYIASEQITIPVSQSATGQEIIAATDSVLIVTQIDNGVATFANITLPYNIIQQDGSKLIYQTLSTDTEDWSDFCYFDNTEMGKVIEIEGDSYYYWDIYDGIYLPTVAFQNQAPTIYKIMQENSIKFCVEQSDPTTWHSNTPVKIKSTVSAPIGTVDTYGYWLYNYASSLASNAEAVIEVDTNCLRIIDFGGEVCFASSTTWQEVHSSEEMGIKVQFYHDSAGDKKLYCKLTNLSNTTDSIGYDIWIKYQKRV